MDKFGNIDPQHTPNTTGKPISKSASTDQVISDLDSGTVKKLNEAIFEQMSNKYSKEAADAVAEFTRAKMGLPKTK